MTNPVIDPIMNDKPSGPVDTQPRSQPVHPQKACRLPGDIASALLAACLIVGRAELECLWIGRIDWRLSTEFSIPPNGKTRTMPEYEECRSPAEKLGVPLQDVYRAALNANPVPHAYADAESTVKSHEKQ